MALSKKQRKRLRKQDIIHGEKRANNHLPISKIVPKTWTQQLTFEAYEDGKHLLLHGMAGTGKTFVSMYLALKELQEHHSRYKSVTIVRSVVPTRDIGFLPGKQDEKIGVYEQPYKAICTELFARGDAYDILKHNNQIHFIPTSYVRGTTLNDTIVLIDEVSNMTFHEIDSLITRLGDNCRVILCGDFKQSDLTKHKEREGLRQFMQIVDRLSDFAHLEFTEHDIVRSPLVREYIIAREDLGLCAA